MQMHAPHQLHQPHEPNEPHQPHQPHEPHQPIIGWWTAGYLALGLWLVHTLHVCRFLLVDWNQITAFPDWQVKPWTALWLGALVPMVALVGVGAIRRWPRIGTVIGVALACELTSQATGRSLFTAAGDVALWGIVVGAYLVRKHYGSQIVATAPAKALSALHSEALGIFRALITVCLFVIGTLGVAVTSMVVSRTFGNDLGQGAAWVQMGSVVYLAIGMTVFMLWPLLRTVRAARARIGELT